MKSVSPTRGAMVIVRAGVKSPIRFRSPGGREGKIVLKAA